MHTTSTPLAVPSGQFQMLQVSWEYVNFRSWRFGDCEGDHQGITNDVQVRSHHLWSTNEKQGAHLLR